MTEHVEEALLRAMLASHGDFPEEVVQRCRGELGDALGAVRSDDEEAGMHSTQAVRAAQSALIRHGGDPGPRGAYAVVRALEAAQAVDAGETREDAHQAAIAEARRRTALRLSMGRGAR